MAAQAGPRRRIDASYSYDDEDGNLLFQVVRFEPKSFAQRRFDPDDPKAKRGGWVWNLDGVRLVPYRLPALLEAVSVGWRVLVVEGEKDADALAEIDEVATCAPMGAGKWRREFARYFQGAEVIVVADKDRPGRAHARAVAESLKDVAAEVRTVEAVEGCHDAADHLASGHLVGDFVPVTLDGPEAPAQWDVLLDRAIEKAEEEGRNNGCLWLVCQLRDHRYAEDEARRVVERYQQAVSGRGKNAFPKREATEVFDKNFFSEPRAPWMPPGGTPYTDLGNAERLVAAHGDDLRFCHTWKSWLTWDGTRWLRDSAGKVELMAKHTVRSMYGEVSAEVDPERRQALAKWARQSEHATRLRSMVELAKSEPGVPIHPSELDAGRMELNVKNGVLDLHNGKLFDHERFRLMSKLAPVEYDPEARCPTWDLFLRRIQPDDESRAFLQRAVGYSMTGDVSEQVLFIAYGTGSNGKSTFLEALRSVFGDYAQKAPAEMFVLKRAGAIPADVARLPGRRFVTASETEDGARLAESAVKELTGGDRVTARYLHENFFEFDPTHKLWLSTNHVPQVHGAEDAIWRRLRLIPFTVTIPSDERDKHIDEKLRRERPGILRWAVEGCLAWQRIGLGESRSVIDATERYRRDSDSFGMFLGECCTIGPDQTVGMPALFQEYEVWACAENLKPMSKIAFGRKLRARGFVDGEAGKDHRKIWRGIGLPKKAGIHLVAGGRAR